MEILERTATNRITLRLQNDILEILKREAHKKDLTLNAFINKILSKNITFEENVNSTPTMILPHDLFIMMLNKVKESEVKEIAIDGPRVVKKLFNIMGLPYDIDHVIHNYFMVLSKYCNWFEFSHKITGGKCRLVYCVGPDAKWVTFVQQYVKGILESLKLIITNESQHDGILVFEFSHKDHN